MPRLFHAFRDLGFLPGFFYLADRVSKRCFGHRMFFYYSIVAQPILPLRRRPGKAHKVIVCDSWEEFEAFATQSEIDSAVLRDRFTDGYKCVVLANQDELLAYAWLALDSYEEDEVRCRFVPSPAGLVGWDFDVYVCPKYRGTLVFVRLWDGINQLYNQLDRTWTMSRISRLNVTSFQSHKSMGAIRALNILFVVVGRMQLMLAPIRPFVHLSLSDKSRPTLEVSLPPNVTGE